MFNQTNQNANKPICQFYQRGNCKHGIKCWNLHPGASGLDASNNVFSGGSQSSVGFSSFGNSTSNNLDKDFLEFVKQVGSEMIIWEEKGMWLLSCLAPLKDHPLLSGFIDTSPEELRFEAYEAQAANTYAAYQTNFNQKLEYHKQLRSALKNEQPEAIEVLKTVFYKSATSSTSKSLFANPQGSLLGAPPLSQPSLFGGTTSNTQTSSLFGGAMNSGSSNIFRVKPQGAPFGAPQSMGLGEEGSSVKSTFGGGSESGLFTGRMSNESTSSAFGNTSLPTQGNVFGGSSQQMNSPNNMFPAAPIANSNQVNPLLFNSKLQNTNSSSLFSAAPPNSAFGTTNVFNSAQPTVFGGTNHTTGTQKPFGNTSQLQENSQMSAFGGGAPLQNNSLFGGSQNPTATNSSAGTFGNNFSSNQPQKSIFGGVNNINSETRSLFGNVGSFQNPNPNSSNYSLGNSEDQLKSNAVVMSEESPFSTNLAAVTPNYFGNGATTSSLSVAPQTSLMQSNPCDTPLRVDAESGRQNNSQNNAENSSLQAVPLTRQIYTPISCLNVEDKAEFEKDVFLRVPLVPPPRELCV